MDRIRITGGKRAQWRHSDLRREERGAAADDREPRSDRRDADAGPMCRASGRRRARSSASSATTAPIISVAGKPRTARAPRFRPDDGASPRARSSTPDAPYELVSTMRASFWVIGADAGTRWARRKRVAARRLRDRHAPGRPAASRALERLGAHHRPSRAATRLRPRPEGAEGRRATSSPRSRSAPRTPSC
jgi:hypothetical protein